VRSPKREFRGVWFPREIWLAADLSFLAKGILVEIDSLSSDARGCFASNRYLAQFFNASQSQISRTISDLEKRGLITIETAYDPAALGGAKRYLRRTELALRQRPLPAKEEDDDGEEGEDEQAAPLRKMRRPPTHNAEGPSAKCVGTLSKMLSIDHESRVLARINNNNNSAARASCDLPVAVVVDSPPSAPDSDPTPDPAALQLLTDEQLFNATLAAQLAAGWTAEEMAAWIDLGHQKANDLGDYLRAVLSNKDNPPPASLRRKREREAKAAILADRIAERDRRRQEEEAADPMLAAQAAKVEAELERRRLARQQREGGGLSA